MLRAEQVSDAIRRGVNAKISDGHNLYLVVKNGRGFWVYQYRDGAVIRSKGLGSAANVTPAQARRARENCAVALRSGVAAEALGIRPTEARGEPFGKVADTYLENHAAEWSPKQQARNRTLLRMHAAPLDKVPVNRITTAQVADVLRPIWSGPGSNRGGKLRSLIERIINGKAAQNPATWERLKGADGLHGKTAETTHHPSMPYTEVPAFMKRLDLSNVEDRAIRFVILTGVRRQEALGARWGELDLKAKRWLVPAARMKNRKDHFVPLSDAAIACLGKRGADNDLIFPSSRGAALGHDALSLRKFGLNYTLHGFRSSLSSWAEENDYPTNVIQLMLAHRKKDDNGKALGPQDNAYMRATRFDERRKLHDAWALFAATR